MRPTVFSICISMLLICSMPYKAIPQSAEVQALISSKELLADAAILRRAYEQLHPGLYTYNSKAQMDAHFSELEHEFSRDRTPREAYLAISIFANKLKCGHSYANFFNQPKSI